jgi:hypothetical protein
MAFNQQGYPRIQHPPYPIVAHQDVEKTDCCGCLFIEGRGEEADLTCNECGAVVRIVPVEKASAILIGMVSSEICSARGTHCGALITFPGFSAIEAFECGEGVNVVLPTQ